MGGRYGRVIADATRRGRGPAGCAARGPRGRRGVAGLVGLEDPGEPRRRDGARAIPAENYEHGVEEFHVGGNQGL